MIAKIIATTHGATKLPVEIYSRKREREFDTAERELDAYLGSKISNSQRSKKANRKRRTMP